MDAFSLSQCNFPFQPAGIAIRFQQHPNLPPSPDAPFHPSAIYLCSTDVSLHSATTLNYSVAALLRSATAIFQGSPKTTQITVLKGLLAFYTGNDTSLYARKV
jgi:hypothetical protein